MTARIQNSLEIDVDRLWETLNESAKIGPGKTTGLNRQTLTEDDGKMRDLFVKWCKAAGCKITIDQVGNIFARREGSQPELAPVLMGSHLDTQVAGGRYDGILGVLAGLEVIRTLNDKNIMTKRSIEVVCWTNEEGVRFQPPMMGASVFAGALDLDFVLNQADDDGILFEEALQKIGYAGTDDRNSEDINSYFELHIEQGPILDDEGIHVGIVTGGYTSHGAQFNITGENAHSGPTPMNLRKDALVGAAIIAADVHKIGWDYAPEGRTTCAKIDISPNQYGIIADHAEIIVDLRHPDPALAKEMYDKVIEVASDASKRANVEIHKVREWGFGNVQFSHDLINLIRNVSAELGISHRHILSAAGHDAYRLADVVPTAMIFTPCKDGITHNENEHIEPEYTAPGVNVLLNSVVARANS